LEICRLFSARDASKVRRCAKRKFRLIAFCNASDGEARALLAFFAAKSVEKNSFQVLPAFICVAQITHRAANANAPTK
jgi:hypothetical protein